MIDANDSSTGARQIQDFLGELSGRWQRHARLRLTARAALGLAVIWAAMLVVWWLAARETTAAQILLVLTAAAASLAFLVITWRRRPEAPSPVRLARLAEDHLPGLGDRLATAADVLGRTGAGEASPIAPLLIADTARRLEPGDADLVISPERVRGARWRAVAACTLLLVLFWGSREPVGQTTRAVRLWAFPARLALEVTPGDARVAPGAPFVVRATTSDAARGLVPELTVRMQDAVRTARMKGERDNGYSFGFESVPRSFGYQVRVAGHATREFHVTLLERPRVARIDLSYVFPSFAGMAPRSDSDTGDIYAPEGSRVTVRVTPRTTTAPVEQAALVLRDGKEVPLRADGEQMVGEFTVSADTSYRVRLRDTDGLENADDPEYFVRRLDDRPPDVRIVRPAGDRQVTPLEEVTIEARADDDHGLDRLELVVGVRGSGEKAVTIGTGGGLSVTGRHTVYLEDLDVKPGDFVSFYARAKDVGRGKRPTEARSDIYFLEVTPFVDEFAMAQSQAMAGAGGQQVDDSVRQQKDIIVGTWKLQRRSAGAKAGPSAADVKTLGRAQAALRRRAETAARQSQMFAGPRRGRPGATLGGGDDEQPALMSAARAMAKAEQSLEAVKPNEALPAEMEALNHLLRAEAEIQRKEIARQQANSSGGGSNRNQQDLSSLFDRELQRQQETNYETPQSVEERKTDTRDELLEKVRELARRQQALARQQDDLARDKAQMNQEEVRRRLERLARDQNELRRQAEQLAQQMQQQGRQQGDQRSARGEQSQGQQQGQSQGQSAGQSAAQANARALREASDDMRAAASELRRESPASAGQRSARALDRLQSVERGLREAGPDEQRRQAGDAQLEARQLADRQRQLADETARSGGAANDDTRRRLAGEQQRLADRADTLNDRVRRLAQGSAADKPTRDRLSEAAGAMERGRVGQQMREVADAVRRGDAKAMQGDQQRSLARELDRLADSVGGAKSGGSDKEGQQLADELAKTRALRERLGDLQREIESAARKDQPGKQADAGKPGDRAASGKEGERGGQDGSGKAGEPGKKPGDPGDTRRLAELRREYLDELRKAGDVGGQLEQSSPGTGRAMSTPVGQEMVSSAPGTEAFKQDFSKWESLHKEIALGLERLEASLSQRVVERAARERLRTGNADRVPDAYRTTVDRYYRALAQEPR